MHSDSVILVWMTGPSDMEAASRLLQQAGVDFRVCADIDSLTAHKAQEVGALLVEEEGLTGQAEDKFKGFLSAQPPWSDLPVILLVKRVASTVFKRPRLQWTGNLTLVDRPVTSTALVSVIRMALKARQRQYEVRDLLAKLSQTVEMLRNRSEQLRALASELTLAEHRERKRLAQLLHDDLQQLLVGAKFRVSALKQIDPQDVAKVGQEINDILNEALEASRSLTAELSPPILREGGLVPSLQWLARQMQDKHGLVVEIETQGEIGAIAEDMMTLLFQATRELLFNVVKHAGVKSARVQVTHLEEPLRITVSDEGVGFDLARLRCMGGKSGGFGLFSIGERLGLLGGKMEIESTPGKGSRFTLVAPLPPLAAEESVRKKIRVILVDDQVVMRQGLSALLKQEADMEIVGQAADAESALALVRDARPDVVLMDIGLRGMDGIEATRIIHAELPQVQVIGLSTFEDAEHADAMRKAGAVEYLTKTGLSQAVVAAIRACASGESRHDDEAE